MCGGDVRVRVYVGGGVGWYGYSGLSFDMYYSDIMILLSET